MRNLTNGNGKVNQKIKPFFNVSLYDLSYHPSFEEDVSSERFPEYSQGKEQSRFTVNRCPELIGSTIWYLKSKHKNLQSGQAVVQRYLTQAGVIILEKIPGLKVVRDTKRNIYDCGDERDRLESSKHSYNYGYRISLTSRRMTIYCFEWTASKISELASDLDLHQETMVIASLIAGLLTIERWIPVEKRNLFFDETIRFCESVGRM
jgi:hypothetical protein